MIGYFHVGQPNPDESPIVLITHDPTPIGAFQCSVVKETQFGPSRRVKKICRDQQASSSAEPTLSPNLLVKKRHWQDKGDSAQLSK